MKQSQKQVRLKQLDEKLKALKNASETTMPAKGWIHAVRSTLNMTMEQLGQRLNLSRQGVNQLEQRESNGSISINTLKEVAEALNMKLVYGLVPKHNSLEKLVEERASALATKIVMKTNQNMLLEDQNISDKKLKQEIKNLSEELKSELKRSLWD